MDGLHRGEPGQDGRRGLSLDHLLRGRRPDPFVGRGRRADYDRVDTRRPLIDHLRTTNDLLSTSSLVVGGTTTTATYGYDILGQVTSSTMTGTPGATGSYTYNAGGNPTKVVDPANGTATPQTFNTNEEVLKATPHSTSGADATFTYDSIGARTSEKETGWSAANSYAYYQTGELKSVSQHTAGTSASYTYNGQGLRTKATETVNSSTHESQTFTWDTQTSTPELLSDGSHYFIYGPTGQVIEQETTTLKGALDLVHNALGSTVATISSTHAVSSESYNVYGAVVGHTGNNTTPIGYAGAYTDPVTGFLALLHRYYDPTTGEFLSRDPDVATTHQPYEYAGDDPANLTDPTGDSCAGGLTTGTALTAFADAYGGWQLQQLAAAAAGYQLEQYAAAVEGASTPPKSSTTPGGTDRDRPAAAAHRQRRSGSTPSRTAPDWPGRLPMEPTSVRRLRSRAVRWRSSASRRRSG